MAKKKGNGLAVVKFIFKALWFILQIPFYFVTGVVSDVVGLFVKLAKVTRTKTKELGIERKRGIMKI